MHFIRFWHSFNPWRESVKTYDGHFNEAGLWSILNFTLSRVSKTSITLTPVGLWDFFHHQLFRLNVTLKFMIEEPTWKTFTSHSKMINLQLENWRVLPCETRACEKCFRTCLWKAFYIIRPLWVSLCLRTIFLGVGRSIVSTCILVCSDSTQ